MIIRCISKYSILMVSQKKMCRIMSRVRHDYEILVDYEFVVN